MTNYVISLTEVTAVLRLSEITDLVVGYERNSFS